MNSKTLFKLIAVCCAFAFATNSIAQTLYGKEGTAADGVTAIDASGTAPTWATAFSNWVSQTGGGSWSGIYGDTSWTTQPTSDMDLEVEADIELYAYEWISLNKIYFHIGNIFNFINSPIIAKAPGKLMGNTELMVGFHFDNAKSVTLATGMINDGMQSDQDAMGNVQDKKMDISILLDIDGDGLGALPPTSYSGNTIWWNVATHIPGTTGVMDYDWVIQLHPTAAQADGDYYLDPVLVCTPVL